MSCGCLGNKKINRNKDGNRIKLKQKCDSCKFEFLSSTIQDCCPKCDKDMNKKTFEKSRKSKS